MCKWIKILQPTSDNFCQVTKETYSLTLFWFIFTNLEHFLSIAAFSWSNWEQYLFKSIVFVLWKDSEKRTLIPKISQFFMVELSPLICAKTSFQFCHTDSFTFFSWRLLFSMVKDGLFHLPNDLLHSMFTKNIRILFYSLWIFHTNNNCWFSLKSKWQQVSSAVQDSSQYSSRFWQCCGLDGLNSFSDLQVPQSLFCVFLDYSNGSNNNWYYCHLHDPQLFNFLERFRYLSSFSFTLILVPFVSQSTKKIVYLIF